MTTIHLTDEVGKIAAQGAAEAGYSRLDDYIRDLIVAEKIRPLGEEMEAELLRSLSSPAIEMTDLRWQQLSQRVRERRHRAAGK